MVSSYIKRSLYNYFWRFYAVAFIAFVSFIVVIMI